MQKKIKKYVKEVFKYYQVYDGRKEKELIESCLDEFDFQIKNGVNELKAYEIAIMDVDEIVKSFPSKKIFKYKFSLLICLISLAVSVLNILFSYVTSDALRLYGIDLLLFMFLLICIIIYSFVTLKRRRWFDFVTILIVFISYLYTFVMLRDFIFNFMIDKKFTALYEYPWLIVIDCYRKIDAYEPFKYVSTDVVYCFNFLISLFGVCIFLLLNIFKKNR